MNHIELRQLIDRVGKTAEAMIKITESGADWIPDVGRQALIEGLAKQGHQLLSEIEAGIPLDAPFEQPMNEGRQGCPISGG